LCGEFFFACSVCAERLIRIQMKLLQRLHMSMAQLSDVELCTRAALLLLKHHQNKLENTISASSVLDSLRVSSKSHIRQRRNVIGVNSAALSAILDRIKSSQVEVRPSAPCHVVYIYYTYMRTYVKYACTDHPPPTSLFGEQVELFSEAREGGGGAADAKSKPKQAKDDEDFIALRLPKGKATFKGKRPKGATDGGSSEKKAKQK
jgi:hypothetical protein